MKGSSFIEYSELQTNPEDSVNVIYNEKLSQNYLQSKYKLKKRFFCKLCNRLMNKPIQSNCGCRFCEKCSDNYFQLRSTKCPSSECKNIEITQKPRDRAIDKEMAKISIQCINDNCNATIFLVNLYGHLQQCSESLINCSNCFMKILVKNKTKHENEECTNRNIICEICLKSMLAFEYEKNHLNAEDPSNFCDKLTGICPFKCSDKEYSNIKLHLMKNHLTDIPIPPKRSIDKKISEYLSKIKLLENKHKKYESVDMYNKEINSFLETLEKISIVKHIGLAFLWQINKFSELVRKSKSNNTPFVLSDPFYTKEIGYKLFLKIYPCGDGDGKGSHLSIYMAIGKGKYDSLLIWPFTQKFKIHILNQNGNKHLTEVFKPNPDSICFQRPNTNINIATGNPLFVDFKTLHQNNDFLKDDILFIKLEING